MTHTLEKDFQYYLDHQAELVEKYRGKFLVIKEKQIIGAYSSEREAMQQSAQKHELGTFLIQECQPGEESYTQTYHSRVVFA